MFKYAVQLGSSLVGLVILLCKQHVIVVLCLFSFFFSKSLTFKTGHFFLLTFSLDFVGRRRKSNSFIMNSEHVGEQSYSLTCTDCNHVTVLPPQLVVFVLYCSFMEFFCVIGRDFCLVGF